MTKSKSTSSLRRCAFLSLYACLGGAVSVAVAGCSSGGHVVDSVDLATARDLSSGNAQDLTKPVSRLLRSFAGCPSEMFDAPPIADEFDSQSTLDANWQWQNDGRFPRPKLDGGALTFGPHNLKPEEWWNNWSPVRSYLEFGDALYCVRFRVKVPAATAAGDSVFDISLRGESGGMVLTTAAGGSSIVLHTRINDSEWVEHRRGVLPIARDLEQTLEAVLYGRGNHFYAEVRNLDSDNLVALAADYALPEKAVVGMLGWRLADLVRIDRAVVGAPSAAAGAIISDK